MWIVVLKIYYLPNKHGSRINNTNIIKTTQLQSRQKHLKLDSNLDTHLAHNTLGKAKPKYSWQYFTISVFLIVNNFMWNLLITKSRDCISDLVKRHASRPYSSTVNIWLWLIEEWPNITYLTTLGHPRNSVQDRYSRNRMVLTEQRKHPSGSVRRRVTIRNWLLCKVCPSFTPSCCKSSSARLVWWHADQLETAEQDILLHCYYIIEK